MLCHYAVTHFLIVMLSVIKLNVIILSVVMMSVMAPLFHAAILKAMPRHYSLIEYQTKEPLLKGKAHYS
jgi:hypothetical protein